MPDIYASITAADAAALERLAGALELRAADLLRRGILNEFVCQITFPKDASYGYTSLPDATYMITLVERGADLLLNAGRIGPGMADALKVEARRRADVDHFYGLIVFASAVARRPA